MRAVRVGALAASLGLLAAGLAGCTDDPEAPADKGSDKRPEAVPAARSWAPAPVEAGGLSSLATSEGDRFALHTKSGDKGFVTGVNLGSTTPTFQPGELRIEASDYRRWFAQMGELGVRTVRIYTIHPPAFYDELASYNTEHPDAPLYLVQGVYLPDESYLDGGTLYDEAADRGFSEELADASAAVHGDLSRDPQPGRASGAWRTDVSPWVAAWIVGVEWDPDNTLATDRSRADAPYDAGKYFTATDDATATERWLARHLDELAEAEAEHGVSVPIAFANWPTTDPLRHPREPNEAEDLVGVDANHVVATDAWPAGTFASYHAYPYYPDFQRYEPGLRKTVVDGEPDPYLGYVRSLVAHHAGLPVLVTEVGVPSSLGSAHLGPLGRDQGNHTEAEAMAIDAELLTRLPTSGADGAFVFAWTDEWFKRTWNTLEHQVPAERRQLWHDPLTNEQHFGLVATDPDRIPEAATSVSPESGPVGRVDIDADASYVYVDVRLAEGAEAVTLEVDAVPGPETADYRVEVDLAAGTANAFVREALDPIRLDTTERRYQPDVGKPWHLYRLLLNRSWTVEGKVQPAEHQDVGALARGTWDPESPEYDSLATWRLDKDTLRMRLAWPMVGLADPSSRTALGEGKPAEAVEVDGLGLVVSVDGTPVSLDWSWPTWNSIGYTERLKAGVDEVAAAFASLNP